MNKRYRVLDFIRGLALINMIIYHGLWDLVNIYNYDIAFFNSKFAYAYQQLICWTFILLSGFCFGLSKHHLKRGLIVFASGLLITLVTYFAIPEDIVLFGVLTLIGSCMLLLIPLQKYLDKCNTNLTIALFIILFVLTKNINKGYIGFADIKLITLPKSLYANMFTAYLGLPYKGFSSSDYFSLIPWLFLFIVGYLLYLIFKKYNLLCKLEGSINKYVEWLGKHSLLIYLFHQPIIMLILMIIDKV